MTPAPDIEWLVANCEANAVYFRGEGMPDFAADFDQAATVIREQAETIMRLREALAEMIWIWDCASVKGVFQLSALHGQGPTKETPRIVAGIAQARAALAEKPCT